MLPLLYLLLLTLAADSSYAWKYPEHNKPEGWPGECVDGHNQSPIDIVTEDIETIVVEPLEFFNYKSLNGTITNNGHSVAIHFDEDNCDSGVTSGKLKGMYYLQEMHFHWPSEHTIDGVKFPMELHMVHYNSKYPDMKHALQQQDGLAVIGIMFYTSENGTEVLDPLLDAVRDVSSKEHTKGRLPPFFNPADFLPADRSSFFRYPGSLTTPPCSEIVTWTILQSKLPISSEQYKIFTEINTSQGKLDQNNRRLQDIHERKVVLMTDNGGHFISLPTTMILICSLAVKMFW